MGNFPAAGDERATMRSRARQPAVAEALRGLGIGGADALESWLNDKGIIARRDAA